MDTPILSLSGVTKSYTSSSGISHVLGGIDLDPAHVAIAEARCDEYEAEGLTGRPIFWQRDRGKILADLAVTDAAAFSALVAQAKAAL